VYFRAALRVGEDTGGDMLNTSRFIIVPSSVYFTAGSYFTNLAEAVLASSVREANVPSLEIILSVIGVNLDRHLRSLGRKVGRISMRDVGVPVPL
jgi:hypothetical protein